MLRNFLGNLGSGVIRLLVTVGILVAVYFLIVRPVLDRTGDITRETNQTIRQSFNQGFGKNGAGVEDVSKTIREVNRGMKREIRKSFRVVESHGVLNPKKLVRCIQEADGNVHKIQRCTIRF